MVDTNSPRAAISAVQVAKVAFQFIVALVSFILIFVTENAFLHVVCFFICGTSGLLFSDELNDLKVSMGSDSTFAGFNKHIYPRRDSIKK